MRPILLLAGLAVTAMPFLAQPAEARPHGDRGWDRHERHEAWREERWRHERWREARRRDEWRREAWRRDEWRDRRAYGYGPPVAYAPQAPGVTLQFNLR
jgi:hypothetical protein